MRLHYHPGKANVVADALSHKSHVNTLMTGEVPKELAENLRELCLEIVPRGYVATLEIQSTLMDKIREAQKTDKEIAEIKERMSKGKAKGFRVTPTMRLCLPHVEARLRGITALWFCRKKGHLHTIPCNEQEWDNGSWLTDRKSVV